MADLKRWSRDEISRMRKEMDRLFDDLCVDFDLPAMFCRMAGDLDLREEGNALVVRLELGNINPDNVDVSVFERRLIISVNSTAQNGSRIENHVFRKEIRLPCIVQPKDVNAEFKNGVLEVRLPKCPTQIGQLVKIIRR
ncbi:Hsp20 family protein [Pseudodesulfovibrio cashew]|uniref:Hsp20 family protein n=1 Tax=Pseudodesulfovibrio cashew TaxID=2678688 RepID=A0A6I6JGN3_9BACT|nr:Hsp20/alpha crystallin family protein [Pseudodesulfovibrio cashew]QGY41331.1 Hsp20 family protein [Pseudodesulfovibrio cashew]